MRFSRQIETAIDSLAEMPEQFSKVAKSRKRQLAIHRMVVSPYLIFCRVEANAVFVAMVHHEKRRPLKRYD